MTKPLVIAIVAALIGAGAGAGIYAAVSSDGTTVVRQVRVPGPSPPHFAAATPFLGSSQARTAQ